MTDWSTWIAHVASMKLRDPAKENLHAVFCNHFQYSKMYLLPTQDAGVRMANRAQARGRDVTFRVLENEDGSKSFSVRVARKDMLVHHGSKRG